METMTQTREEQIIEAAEKFTYQEPPQYSEIVHKTRKVMCAYETGFIDGCVWADQHPNWISVEDELPEKENEFEFFSKVVLATNGVDFWRGMYNYDNECWFTYDMWPLVDVTHWMPLPQPPRKED